MILTVLLQLDRPTFLDFPTRTQAETVRDCWSGIIQTRRHSCCVFTWCMSCSALFSDIICVARCVLCILCILICALSLLSVFKTFNRSFSFFTSILYFMYYFILFIIHEATQTHCYNPVAPAYPIWAYYAHGQQRRCQEDPVSLPSGRMEKTARSSPHPVAQHRPTGFETTPPYAPLSSRFGPEPPSVEDDVDVLCYAIVSCMPETTTSAI